MRTRWRCRGSAVAAGGPAPPPKRGETGSLAMWADGGKPARPEESDGNRSSPGVVMAEADSRVEGRG
jgi:hypothetical protein